MHDEGTQAQETIARLTAELEWLRREVTAEHYARELRQAFALVATAGTIATPVDRSRLLEMIVSTAAHIIAAQAASLFLVDEDAGELVFEVALGEKAAEVKSFRVPLGHGIAGLVAATGQAMAISDAQADPRHASEIARSVGYLPKSILCVPLLHDDRVIGVLELLDKQGAPSFSPADTQALGRFADLAAVAIAQSSADRTLATLLREVLRSLDKSGATVSDDLWQGARAFAESMTDGDVRYRRSLELAELVQEIAWQGEQEMALCQAVLRGFAAYVRQRANPMSQLDALVR
jgi:GAF domain-containing protein